MLSQKLQQKLLQKLSPQQIQLMKLLQIPTMALEQRIKQEIEENPALEELTDSPDEFDEDGGDNEDYNEDQNEEPIRTNDDFDLNDYIDDDDTPYYKYNVSNTAPDDEIKAFPHASTASFHEILETQLGFRDLTEKQMLIGRTIIGNLDESGYLQRDMEAMIDDFAFTMNIEVTLDEIEEILAVIQDFDPAGVGAKNLQECLIIQLKRKENPNLNIQTALMLISDYFEEFSKKHYDKILKKAAISTEQLKSAVDEILKLNPKPGNSFGESEKNIQYIIPDFIISNNDGFLELRLNSRNTPELRVSQSYQEMFKTYAHSKNNIEKHQKEALLFIKQKIDSAKWFIDAINQRQNTLFITMQAILDYQREFFLDGDETLIKPMILKDIAEIVKLDISTISRVASSKYVQTPFGTFLLKSFFSESMTTESGEEVSTIEIKKILTDSVDNENKAKPYTDDQLVQVLQQKGYNIARRTIAKYREQLGIPVARLRKEL